MWLWVKEKITNKMKDGHSSQLTMSITSSIPLQQPYRQRRQETNCNSVEDAPTSEEDSNGSEIEASSRVRLVLEGTAKLHHNRDQDATKIIAAKIFKLVENGSNKKK